MTFSTTAATGSFTIAQTTGLTTTKMASPTTISAVGTLITYSFTVTNNGNVTMSDVVLADLQTTPNTDTLASGPTCTSLTGPAGALLGQRGHARARSGRQLHRHAGHQPERPQRRIDSRLRHRDGQDPGRVPSRPTRRSLPSRSPRRRRSRSASPSPATASTASPVETSSFTVTNNGNVTLTNVGVADVQTGGTGTLPATPTCQSVSVSPFTCSGTTVTLAPGQVAMFTTTYTVTQADINNGTTITDSAKASGTAPGNVAF